MLALCLLLYAASSADTGRMMTGQPHDVPVDSSAVLAAARFAVSEFNRDNAENRLVYEIVNITSAKIQVVAGINYILEVRLGSKVCKRNETSHTCELHSDSKAS
ncbi:cystatin-C-like [Echeneis naucrates]|uniref:Cystatin-C-like n=1 Tax=Echeneis naucrates TaxID=173247 RepID=A0A665TXI2_ECHNA|nr:cystatin-C-like [Echeneis naucrates]